MQNQQQPAAKVELLCSDIKNGVETRDGLNIKIERVIRKLRTLSFMIDLIRKNMNEVSDDIKRDVEAKIKRYEMDMSRCNTLLEILNAGLEFISAREKLELACQILPKTNDGIQEPPTKKANTADK